MISTCVLLELHPGAAAVAEPAARERVDDVGRRHLDVGGQTLEDGDEGRAVGLARSEPTQHGASLSRCPQRSSDGVHDGQDERRDRLINQA